MKCPKCKSTSTRVTCTQHQGNETKRYCRCLDCGHRYITLEAYLIPKSKYRRTQRGEANNLSVLTEANVREIRQLAFDNTYESIAKKYGIHKSTVYRIVHFKIWSHI
mgnify:CR=1 FL=1